MSGRKTILNIVIVVLVLLAALFIYRFFIARATPATEPAGLIATVGGETGVDATDEFVNILLSLQKIDLSGEFLTNPAFVGLTDFSTVLADQVPGRANPFAPAGQGGRPAASPGSTGGAAGAPNVITDTGQTAAPAAGQSGGGSLRDQLLEALNP